jgi:hypothetical protein
MNRRVIWALLLARLSAASHTPWACGTETGEPRCRALLDGASISITFSHAAADRERDLLLDGRPFQFPPSASPASPTSPSFPPFPPFPPRINWTMLTLPTSSWDPSNCPCFWEGVTCEGDEERIISLRVPACP